MSMRLGFLAALGLLLAVCGARAAQQQEEEDHWPGAPPGEPPQRQPAGTQEEDPKARIQRLLDARRRADETVWKSEREAQRYEQTFVALWDDLRSARDKLAVLGRFDLDEIVIGNVGDQRLGALGIRTADLNAEPRRLDRAEWIDLLVEMFKAGYRIVQSEWHHADFRAGEGGRRESTFRIVINATNTDGNAWYDITGPLEVVWSDRTGENGTPVPASIDATGLTVSWRTGFPFFETVELGRIAYPANYGNIIARDLDGDGLSEVICPTDNAVFRNRGDGTFEREILCDHPIRIVIEGLIADFTGDGLDDLLVTGSNPPPGTPPSRYLPFLYTGDGSDRFRDVPTLAVDPEVVVLGYPNGVTAGDIDADGDLDLFVPQYLQPYVGGQFPTPYYDANDGHPSYLLLNSGDGTFLDVTESAGLAAKRNRRSFRSSFVDLDEDGDLDLLVVGDFAGIDLYANDGTGRFTDVTSSMVDLATNFGMAHTFGDFDTDGFVDLYVTGMASTTARRLHRMGLGPQDMPEHQSKRMEIAYGNRMYLRQAPGRFAQPPFKDTVARSGWSWGCVTVDFDNDGRPDIYVGNGNKSGRSAIDYCTTFWCHDIYAGSSEFDATRFKVYLQAARPYLTGTMSWNGFEHNHLLMNLGDEGFLNVAFLVNTAIETDCRAVIADDFDADGRPDLLVDTRAGRRDRDRRLVLLMNRGPQHNNWIGLRLTGAPTVSTLGARITMGYPGGTQGTLVVAGDSYGAQHAPMKHFGLGGHETVDFIQVRWPDGSEQRLDNPAVNRYHVISAGDR